MMRSIAGISRNCKKPMSMILMVMGVVIVKVSSGQRREKMKLPRRSMTRRKLKSRKRRKMSRWRWPLSPNGG